MDFCRCFYQVEYFPTLDCWISLWVRWEVIREFSGEEWCDLTKCFKRVIDFSCLQQWDTGIPSGGITGGETWLDFFFFFWSFENFYFIYKEWVLFPPKVDVLGKPSKEVQLVQLNEADVLRILAETLAAHIEAVFPDQTVPVWADPAAKRNGILISHRK